MANQSVNLQISVKQIIDLILQLPTNEQENIIKQISIQKEKIASNYTELSEKINGFQFLEKNWDSYNADTISTKSIQKSISVLKQIIDFAESRFLEMHVFPMRNGGIQFELDSNNFSLEIEINTKGDLKLIHFDEEGEILKEINKFEVKELKNISFSKNIIVK